jgi:hypothetical protein
MRQYVFMNHWWECAGHSVGVVCRDYVPMCGEVNTACHILHVQSDICVAKKFNCKNCSIQFELHTPSVMRQKSWRNLLILIIYRMYVHVVHVLIWYVLWVLLDPDCPDNVGSLTSHKPIGLQGLLRGYLYFMETECASCELRTGL